MKIKSTMLICLVVVMLCSIAIGNSARYHLITGNLITICDEDNAGATSTLIDKKDPTRYMPNKMFDGDIKTAWSEGEPGPGIGVKIVFEIPTPDAMEGGAKKINIINGLAYSKNLFLSNNRIKEFVLEYYVGVDIGVDKNFCAQYLLNLYRSQTFTLQDTMDKQSLNLNLDYAKVKDFWRKSRDMFRSKGYKVLEGEYGRYLFGVLTIKSVYKGTKYDDTCISEISFE